MDVLGPFVSPLPPLSRRSVTPSHRTPLVPVAAERARDSLRSNSPTRILPFESIRNSAGRAMSAPSTPALGWTRSQRRITSSFASERIGKVYPCVSRRLLGLGRRIHADCDHANFPCVELRQLLSQNSATRSCRMVTNSRDRRSIRCRLSSPIPFPRQENSIHLARRVNSAARTKSPGFPANQVA